VFPHFILPPHFILLSYPFLHITLLSISPQTGLPFQICQHNDYLAGTILMRAILTLLMDDENLVMTTSFLARLACFVLLTALNVQGPMKPIFLSLAAVGRPCWEGPSRSSSSHELLSRKGIRCYTKWSSGEKVFRDVCLPSSPHLPASKNMLLHQVQDKRRLHVTLWMNVENIIAYMPFTFFFITDLSNPVYRILG